ncbi:hypothetical protein EIP91_002010 [Steccherinum ochraceum]|uniref:Uncharacterized protein n=1 Tax=Steccherinum ochraceum TaxID=92696 RepID=A0A4R0RJ57_9APHY|nr:hypothetical protein EIP91_002010 [Steccherinum ochraceum]
MGGRVFLDSPAANFLVAPPLGGHATIKHRKSGYLAREQMFDISPQWQKGVLYRSLKIKLSVPPNIKFRRGAPGYPSNVQRADSSSRPGPSTVNYSDNDAGSSRLPLPVQAARRPGRPPKASSHAHVPVVLGTTQKDRTREGSTHGPHKNVRPANRVATSTKRKGKAPTIASRASGPHRPPARAPSFLQPSRRMLPSMGVEEDSDSLEEMSDIFPTFMPAASISSQSSSSASSSSELSELTEDSSESEDDADESARTRRRKTKGKHDVFEEEPSRKRHDPVLNRWEIRSRRQSVGPDGGEHDMDSAGDSSEDDGAVAENEDGDDDEEEDDEDDEGEEEAEADGENGGSMEDDEVARTGDGKLGVSFGGTGWSEDDEESSFDADIFFANLDGSSESDTAPTPRLAAQVSDEGSDMDESVSFSADEDDALFLMDVDPTTHVRRDRGEFEFGVSLGGLAAAWDDPFGMSYVPNLSDVEMSVDGSSSTEDGVVAEESGVLLEETDGETTEDELVDANGLPNPRAMMLFKWPTSVSTVDPLSTMSPRSNLTPPADAPQSVRIALASFSAHHGSPPPTPAEILAGKLSLDDYDDVDTKDVHVRSKCAMMGQFIPTPESTRAFAVVDGTSTHEASTPFPRSRIQRPLLALAGTDASSDNDVASPTRSHMRQTSDDLRLIMSSDDGGPQSLTQTSEDISSTETFDLDDVLDATFLGGESPTFTLERLAEMTPRVSAFDAMHLQNLNRWDRIPVATFRQTRETATQETGASDTAINPPAMSDRALLGESKGKGTSKNDSRRKLSKKQLQFLVSPVIFPTQDADVKASGSSGVSQVARVRRDKVQRESRKDLVNMKKSFAKQNPRKPQPHRHHHHHHYPNSKSRASASMQRTHNFGSSSAIPHLNL